MHTAINQIVQQFFRKDSLDQVSKDELQKFVEDYPYATVGHLLLAKKEADGGNNPDETLRDTALYLNNPLWLQWLLDNSKFHEQKELTIRERQPEYIAPDPMSGTETEVDIPNEQADGPGNVVADVPDTATNSQSKAAAIDTGTTVEQQDSTTYTESEAEADDTGNAEENEKEDMPVFQSYHTIDYFASQGIRLQPSDLGKDKLGQQLRSFTDWLRSMKKLPQTATGDEDPSEQTVRVIAEHSIEEREVLTEAMAEVWAKQGNRQKASEIYRKLSLLNPAKSAYFAAKIDQL